MTILHVILFTLLTLREMSSGERGFNTFRICAAKICVKIPLKMSLGRVLLTKGPPYLCHLKHITYVLSVYLYYPHITADSFLWYNIQVTFSSSLFYLFGTLLCVSNFTLSLSSLLYVTMWTHTVENNFHTLQSFDRNLESSTVTFLYARIHV